MDFHYDGQIRRYVTQFMRVFIGFKYQAGDGEQRLVPVMYGDLTKQVASIIKDNSENKMPTVPRIACYITGLELDTSRLADSTFVSKMQVRERTYENVVALRAVSSTDGMTADWCHLPYEFLGKISNEIINKVKGVNRVVYDISSKPPATIEWE